MADTSHQDESRVAIVTGASSGIGRALTLLLTQNKCRVVVVGRSGDTLNAVRDECLEQAEVAVLATDVVADDAPARAADLAIERFGRLDWLVNNAGVGKPMPVDETSDDLLDYFLNVHLRAPFRFCREALVRMADGGAIVNVASSFAIIGGLRGGAYSAAKSGIIGLSKHMAAQYGPRGIRTNVVAPGVLETPMTAYAWESERFQRMNFDMTPLNRTGTAEDAAQAIYFLLSDAARFINGQVLAVDGGWTSTKFLSEAAITAKAVGGAR